MFKLAGGPVSWISKKQQTVALSTTEAEYMASSMAVQEAIWLRSLLKELGYNQVNPTPIYQDNISCIQITKNPEHHSRMKHIDIRHHFI